MGSFLGPLLRDACGRRLQNERTGAAIATHVETAFDSASRNKGLLKRDEFAEGSALVIAPSNAVHTFFMRFAIDLLFVAKDGRIVKIRHAVGPWRLSAAFRAYAVVELPAGTLAGTDIRPGDRLVVV